MSRTQVKEQVAFQEIRSNAVSLFVSQQGGNHSDSMALLSKNGLRPLTHQEALSRSSELITELKGKWFYLDGQGIQENGIYTFSNKGELVASPGNGTIDQKVRVYPGNQPLSLDVVSDNYARYGGRRFVLVGGNSPYDVAPVVVGVKQAQAGSVAAKQQVSPKLLAKAESSIAKLEAAEQAGALAKGITGPLKDLVRAVQQ